MSSKIRSFFAGLFFLCFISYLTIQAPANLSYGNTSLLEPSIPKKASLFIAKKQADYKELMEKELQKNIVPGEVIVKVKLESRPQKFYATDSKTLSRMQRLSQKYAMVSSGKPNMLGQIVFKTKAKNLKELLALVAKLRNDPDVEYAEPNFKLKVTGEKISWGLSSIETTKAWQQNGVSGNGVVVAVVDTGVDYNHPDIDQNIWVNSDEISGNGVDDDGNGFIDDYLGWDFAGWIYELKPDNDPMDEIGHGTHVAGIIAAEKNGSYVVGVAPKAKIMAVKVFCAAGYATARTVADGILYAANNGADIINLSLGSYYYSRAIEEAIKYATLRGVLVVAAAGNDWWDLPSYPAAYEDVISVGSIDEDGKRSWFSNFGKIDLVAPGSYIESLEMDGRTVVYSGTSMAAPHVCGVAALVKEKHPSFNGEQIRQVLESTAIDLGKPGKDVFYGSGLVNAYLASTTSYAASAVLKTSYRGYLFADGEDEKLVKIKIFDESMSPISNLRINLSATGSLPSSSVVYTDLSGEATVSLTTLENKFLTTLRAETTLTGSASIDFMVKRTDASLENVWISTENYENGYSKLRSYFKPGQKVFLMFDVFNHYYQPIEATITYEVKDNQGNSVDGLCGSMTVEVVGENYGWFPFLELYMPCGQNWFATDWMTLPDDIEPGVYSVCATITAQGKTSSFSSKFTVLQPAPVLLYGSSERRFWDRSSGFEMYSSITYGGSFIDALNSSGYLYTYWDKDLEGAIEFESYYVEEPNEGVSNDIDNGQPPASVEDWPLFFVFDQDSANQIMNGALSTYLLKGGRVFISSENPFTYASEQYYEEPFFGLSEKRKPPVPTSNPFGAMFKEIVEQPIEVIGEPGGLFEGSVFNIDPNNWEGQGAYNQLMVDSFNVPETTFSTILQSPILGRREVLAKAYPLLSYDNGWLAASLVETEECYRGAFFSFGIEGMQDATERRRVVGAVLNWLFEAPYIDEVSIFNNENFDFATTIKTSDSYTIYIRGRNFVPLGNFKVMLGDYDLSDYIVQKSSTQIELNVDGSIFAPGTYTLTVFNPDGKSFAYEREITVEAGVKRIYGANRILTAIEVSRAHFKESPNVVIATAWNYADALSAVPLARFLNCPILLTNVGSLPSEVIEEISRLGAAYAVIVGGPGAVSEKVVETLEENGLIVERIGGSDRYETSAMIAERLANLMYPGFVPKAYVVTGENFADAISASPLAGYEYLPVVLVKKNSIPESVRSFLENYGVQELVIVGGFSAVSASVEAQLPGDKLRIHGANRYETSARAAEYAVSELGFSSNIIYVATGAMYPDALTSGVCAAVNGNPLILVSSELPLSRATEDFLTSQAPVNLIRVIGGPAVVSEEVVERITNLVR